jgi:hypothetical protein
MTECSETLFPFEAHFSRQVVAQFEGSWLTTEGGSLLLRQADRKIGLLRRVTGCFTDYRQPERIEHRLEEMLAQRIYGLALPMSGVWKRKHGGNSEAPATERVGNR